MGAFNFFQSIDHLEPKCSKCQSKIEYGITTKFDDKVGSHVCLNCGEPVK